MHVVRFQIHVSTDVAMATVQSKNFFVDFDLRNGISRYSLVTLPIFAMFHPQTTEMQPSKVECFSTKALKFQQCDVIFYDVSADLGILFGVWNSLVMSYLWSLH